MLNRVIKILFLNKKKLSLINLNGFKLIQLINFPLLIIIISYYYIYYKLIFIQEFFNFA